jgi:hypothetical protein
MIRFVFMLCAFAEGFLVWFLMALIRERRHNATRSSKTDSRVSQPAARNALQLSQESWTLDAGKKENALNLTIRVKF